MMTFWVSWYNTVPLEQFEMHWPWWISGCRISDEAETICAAVRAEDETAAKRTVRGCYDEQPEELEWRFCEAQPNNWSPFNDRFSRLPWMQWEDGSAPP